MSRSRQLLAILAVALLLLGNTNVAEAKPAYCDQALWACRDQCQTYFGDFGSILVTACQSGCAIGWQDCGNPA